MLETIARRCTVTTAASYSLVQYARHLGANRSSYLPNGVDERFFVHQNREKIRQELGVGTDEILIGYVGSLAFWLNMRRMLFGLARAKRAGIPVRFLILGGNLHSDYVSMLRGWIEEAGLTEISILTGFVPHQEVPKYIAGMDLGVLPHDERNPVGYYAGPNKIWEYLSQGVPVLASPIPEALFYGQYLEIVSDEEGYFNRIRDFSLNPEPFIEKARKGREVAKSMVWDKSAERMERVMNEAMISS
jgi:glycosyltransferase involved in cell wall biosynthesis